MIQKKIGRFISLRMGIAMSLVMSFVGSTRGAITGTLQALSNMPEGQRPPFIAVYMSNWLPSFIISAIISCILAVGIGFIVPMKKVNDGIANATKTKGFLLRLIQSFVSGLIYAPIIGLVMACIAATLFSVPNTKKGMDKQIAGIEAEIQSTQGEIAELEAKGEEITPPEAGQLEGLKEKMGSLNGELAGVKGAKEAISIPKVAIKTFLGAIIFEFIFAWIVSMVLEPIVQKAAFKKYIPNYGQGVEGDEDINS